MFQEPFFGRPRLRVVLSNPNSPTAFDEEKGTWNV
jgi:hypothetical protein